MSQNEHKRRKMLQTVCREAWRLLKMTQIQELSVAMKLAWAKVRSRIRIERSKVAGVTFENRQILLKRLSLYKPKDIKVSIIQESNPFDPNALRVEVAVHQKGLAHIGYVPKEVAHRISPFLQKGYKIAAWFEEVTGIYTSRDCLGMTFRFALLPE